jgi:AcrR family transcriptional regulator
MTELSQESPESSARYTARREDARRRLVVAGRVQLAGFGQLVPATIVDICAQVGVSQAAFRGFFPNDDAFFDAIHDSLVEECADRLRACVDAFEPSASGDTALVEASAALANSWPLTRGGMLIRSNRRNRGIRDNADGLVIARAERMFVGALLGVFTDLMTRLGRVFTWEPKLAVRVILDTYERSFEMWLLSGNEELDFSSSSYIRRTLPELLGQMSRPL